MTTAIRDTTRALSAAEVLRVLPSRPRVLALGEPTHGEDLLLEVRNELFQQLVPEGYRTIAIESDCLLALVVDDYVTSGKGSLDEVMANGFSHGLGASAANRELVRWMRAYNDGRPAAEQVRFAGIDGPLEISGPESPQESLTALYAYLASRVDADLLPCPAGTIERLLEDAGRWVDPAVMLNPARSVGQSPEAARLRLLADDLVALLDAETPHLIAASSRDEWERACLHGRAAVGLLRYHHWLADTSPGRMTRLLGVRDSMMADNLVALAGRGPVLVHAHNLHLKREKAVMGMWQGRMEWWGAGSLAHARLGADYAFLATALGTIRHQGVGTPPTDTLEGMLYALPEDRFLVDSHALAALLGDAAPPPRESAWFGYAPLDPAHLSGTDGLVFVKDSPQG
ncbi:erythromycin esterase family protein [Catellatospora sp. IY07-71]|uniref:erythromycin esterase family protein n=1 Tax=Catellatospora sp. IY07-71 TaxID=2728827 RepID=UPI001BB2F7DD|nr:erythromycin esterase family protein [Catellatospora sp. IY07-71]